MSLAYAFGGGALAGFNGGGGSSKGGGGPGTGALAMSVGAFPAAPVNLSTVGVIDWFYYGPSGSLGTGSPPSFLNSTASNYHWKRGGLLYQSLVWLGAAVSSAPSTYPGTVVFSSNASDDSYGAALSATDGTYAQCSGTGFGFQVNIAAALEARTLRIYLGAKSVNLQITASLEDGSADQVSQSFNAASSVNEQRTVDITFASGSSSRLRVTVAPSALNGGVQAVELWGMAEF